MVDHHISIDHYLISKQGRNPWTAGNSNLLMDWCLCLCKKKKKKKQDNHPEGNEAERYQVVPHADEQLLASHHAPATLPGSTTTRGASLQPVLESESRAIEVKYSFSYEELATATGYFSDANCLGRGGFGQVYLGKLLGKEVAIKKLFQLEINENEFEAEVMAISRTDHPNLVKMIGSCIDENNKLLVLECIPNESLHSHLHGKANSTISWRNRFKIALGSAKGLAYLHEHCNPRIIHRDIKGNNILLDFDFEPKIADFGLARDISYSISHITTKPKGTIGYLAPECWSERLTDKSDVFSFGIVLLELITGKEHIFLEDNQSYNLAVWVVPQLKTALEKGEYSTLVDPKLRNEYVEEEMGRMVYCAAASVYKPEKNRPLMSEIVQALEGNLPVEVLWQHSNDEEYLYDGAPYH